MTFAEYVRIDAVNWSTLKEARKSMRHYQHRLAQPLEDTTRLALGRAAHTAILEPDRFPLDYALWTGERRAGKEWAAFCEAHPDQTILKADEYARCLAMRDAVRSHPAAGALLAQGRPEVTLRWTDEETGLACKARIDWLSASLDDLKTTADADAQRFGMNAARMGYHCQLAFYRRACAANGIEVDGAKIIAVEAEAPHDVVVYALSDDDLAVGDYEIEKLLRAVATCREAKAWPGRAAGEVPLMLPSWVFSEGWDTDDDVTGLDLVVNGQAMEG